MENRTTATSKATKEGQAMTSLPTIGSYVLAQVRGFSASSLRCRVTRVDAAAGCVWVLTADLCSAGVPLTLDIAKVEAPPETESLRHKRGLVAF